MLLLNERSNGRDKIEELDSSKIRDAVIQVYQQILDGRRG
jgi:hypothetical protein